MRALATIIFVSLVAYLFYQDRRTSNESTQGLWVPLVWMFLAGSRWVSSWLNLRPQFASVEAYAEGSPVDRTVFLALIVAGVVVLSRRKIDWADIARRNTLLLAYFAYCLISIIWADYSVVALKRWIKDLGNPIMALVILTAPNPIQALTTTIRRLSFLLLPLSVLFVKYLPELGRVYHVDGSPMYTGIGHQKNDLGLMCLVTGTYFSWQILIDKAQFATWARASRWSIYMLVAMLVWLLYMSNSQTSLMCLLLAIGVMLMQRMQFVQRKPGRLVGLIVGGALTYGMLEALFSIKEQIFLLLGRDPSLTNRTELWALLFDIGTESAVLGSGFMSFWSGERMLVVWRHLGEGVNQAHSGYIEQYLNLGYVGVGFIALLMLRALWRIREHLNHDASMATLRLCFLLAAVLYNYTEASFYGINNMWVLTLVAFIQLPAYSVQSGPASVKHQVSRGRPHGASAQLASSRRAGIGRPSARR